MKLRKIVLTACILFLTACTNTPESTIENFYAAVSQGNITEAKSYLSNQLLGMFGDKKITAGLIAEYEKMQICEGIQDIQVEIKGEGEIRTGTATITFNGDCPPRVEKTKLIKEDGAWKITASK